MHKVDGEEIHLKPHKMLLKNCHQHRHLFANHMFCYVYIDKKYDLKVSSNYFEIYFNCTWII